MASEAAYVSDEASLQGLAKEIKDGQILLRKLSGLDPKTHDVGKSQKLPAQELQQAAGLAFFEAKKAGLIITGVSGKGFMIKRVKSQQGRYSWSAPVLFNLGCVGFGLSAGISASSTLLILDTDKAVNDFLHTTVSLDSEMTVAAGKAGRHMHDAELNVAHPRDTFQGACYSVAHGAMVDVSFQGVKISINEKEMRKIYGPNVDDKLVLNGQQSQLPLVEPLLEEIENLCHGGSRAGTTVRDFTKA